MSKFVEGKLKNIEIALNNLIIIKSSKKKKVSWNIWKNNFEKFKSTSLRANTKAIEESRRSFDKWIEIWRMDFKTRRESRNWELTRG